MKWIYWDDTMRGQVIQAMSLLAAFGLVFGCRAALGAPRLHDTEVDAFNVHIGTQTFGPRYHFSTNSALLETAEAIRDLGSDVVKFYMGKEMARQYPGLR